MKRRTLYVGAALITFVVGAVAASGFDLSPRVFRLTSEDGVGGPGLGASENGIGASTKTWVSPDGPSVEETIVSYSSHDFARRDFDLELKRRQSTFYGGGDLLKRRVIVKIGEYIELISLENNEIKYLKAPNLETLQAFNNCWLTVDQ
jgi:hypothetical protein